MKRLFTLAALLITITAFSQKTELSVALNSGLFSFGGQSAEKTSFFNSMNTPPYTNNPYGSGFGFSYGLSGNVKRVTKHHILYGLDLGYEQMKSKTEITQIDQSGVTGSFQTAANGNTFLKLQFINLEPFAGYRLVLHSVAIDATIGLDVAHCLDARENGSATSVNEVKYTTDKDRKTIATDIRPRFQMAAQYRRYGLYVGYSAGQTNYLKDYVGGTNEAYARLIRFGIIYRLNGTK